MMAKIIIMMIMNIGKDTVREGSVQNRLRCGVEDDHEDYLDHKHDDHVHEDNDAYQHDDNHGDHERWRGDSKRIEGYITTGLRSTFDDDNDD